MATSTASMIPQYQPIGMIRDRSQSLDPASFLRRQSYDYTRAAADQAYGHRADVARWDAGQRAATAGITGGARESLINSALGNVGDQRAQEMSNLGASYLGNEASGIQADRAAGLQEQSIRQQLMQAALSYAASGRGVTNEGLANTISAIQRGDPNAFNWLVSRDLVGSGATPAAPAPQAGGIAGPAPVGGGYAQPPVTVPTFPGHYPGERQGPYVWNGQQWVTGQ